MNEIISVSVMLFLPTVGVQGLDSLGPGVNNFTGASWPDKMMEVRVPESSDLLLQAIAAYNGKSGLVIKQVVGETPNACDIQDRIVTGDLTDDYCGSPYPENTLAYGVWASVGDDLVDAGILFNNAFDWDGEGYSPLNTLIHELGHIVGLNHVPVEIPSVMNPVYNDAWSKLQPQDIENLITLYGSPREIPKPVPAELGWLPAVNSVLLH